jgi:hypothetical protein
MDLSRKIDEIRQKPERIRKRYAFFCTAVSMVFVLLIWAISLASQRVDTSGLNSISQSETWQQFGEQKKSLEDITTKTKNSVQQGLAEAQKAQGSQKNVGANQTAPINVAAPNAEMPSNTP